MNHFDFELPAKLQFSVKAENEIEATKIAAALIENSDLYENGQELEIGSVWIADISKLELQ